MTNAAAPAKTVSFATFPKLRTGDDCDGAIITVDGNRAGYVQRVVEWRDVGGVCVTRKPTITGYRVVMFGEHATEEEPEFSTLAAARSFVRALF
jgi:hypothetical protein